MCPDDLSSAEAATIAECLRAAVDGPFFPDSEFPTLIGAERAEVKSILSAWPGVEEQEVDVASVINSVIVNLLGYPHHCEQEWSKYISASPRELRDLLARW